MAEPTTSITPDTRLHQLLRDFPALEPVLMRMSPAFKRLRNPVLRRTVARVATLRQVATVGGVPLSQLLSELRQAAGLEEAHFEEQRREVGTRPPWARAEAAVKHFDATALIDGGDNPLTPVMADLRRLQPGETYELTSPFVPAPLIDLAQQRGLLAWSVEEPSGTVQTYLHLPADALAAVGAE